MIKKELLKSKLFIRLIVAVGLIAVAVAGLTVMQRFGGDNGGTQTPPPKPPPVHLPPQPQPAPQPASQPVAAAPEVRPQPETVKLQAPEPIVPAAPEVKREEHKVKRAERRLKEKHPHKVRHAAKQNRPKKQAAIHESGYFTLQFGVFSSDANASKMSEQLKRQGINPITNLRVLVGPYPDRETALLEKKKIEVDSSLLSLSGGRYALQIGDFGPEDEAHDLAGKLKLDGHPVMTQARIRGGSYLSREEAEKAAKGFAKSGIRAIPVRR